MAALYGMDFFTVEVSTWTSLVTIFSRELAQLLSRLVPRRIAALELFASS